MAGNNIVKYLLIGGGAYLLWNTFSNSQAASATGSPATGGGGNPPPPPSDPAAVKPSQTTIDAMNAWAKTQDASFTASSTNSSDVWHWAWTQILKKPGIPDAIFFALWPGGTAPMTAAKFVTDAATKGLSGLGRNPPAMISAPAAAAVWLAHQRSVERSPGVRNYVRAGTPMVGGRR